MSAPAIIAVVVAAGTLVGCALPVVGHLERLVNEAGHMRRLLERMDDRSSAVERELEAIKRS